MRWTSLVLVLGGSGCFDPTDLDGEEEGTGASTGSVSDTDPSASASVSVSESVSVSISESESESVTITDASNSESDTQPTATSIDTSASTDPTTDDSASTTTTDTDPGEDDSTSTTMTPDMGVPGPCDTYDPDCPAGFKCTAYADDGGSAWNAMFCLPLDPDPVGVGEACEVEGDGVSGIDDCDAGSMCWGVDPDTLEGECVAFCGGTADDPTCDAGHLCVISNGGVLNLCQPYCDPLLQDCADGDACYPVEEAFICAPDASGEGGAYGDPCEYINVCDPGLACIGVDFVPGCNGDAGCCSPFCALSDPGVCPGGGQECLAWFDDGAAPTPALQDVGVCAVPP